MRVRIRPVNTNPTLAFLRNFAAPAILALLMMCASGCTAPLGPGFTVERRSLEVAYVSSEPLRVHVRASWRLKNTGNKPVETLSAAIPEKETLGLANLQASVDGRAASAAAAVGRSVEIPLDPPWPQNERRELLIEYDLQKAKPFPGVVMETDAVALTSGGWSPALRPPKGAIAEVKDEKPLDITVRVPQGFRALANGDAHGVRKDAGDLVYRFRAKDENGQPYVVAGRFSELRFRRGETIIIFWTPQSPWPEDQLEQAGTRLADCMEAYERAFGLLPGDKEDRPYRVIAVPHWPGTFVAGFPLFLPPAFPRGALVQAPENLQKEPTSYPLAAAAYGLAESWFGTPARTGFGAIPVFHMSLIQYAARFVGAENFGRALDRTAVLRESLRAFDHFTQGPNAPKENSLAAMAAGAPGGDRLQALIKSELFLAALEDRCGQDALRQAMRHLAESLRDTAYGYTELRSAVELECQADLGPMFREWTTETGIPGDFRLRYQTAGSPGAK